MNIWFSDSSCRSVLQKPDWDSAPGGSVTLNCTLLTGTSEGEGRVYWFLQESGGFSWGSMKRQSGSSSESASGSESDPAEHSCDFTSPQRGVGPSDGGTSLCAVAACGQILLGTGMRLHVGGEPHSSAHTLFSPLALLFLLTVSVPQRNGAPLPQS